MLLKEDLINFENEIKDLFEQGKIRAPIHLSCNNEDMLIDLFKNIKYDDWVLSTHRNHYHALLHGDSRNTLDMLSHSCKCYNKPTSHYKYHR